jgi:hypothetical protein
MRVVEKRAHLIEKFHEIFEGPPPVEKISAHPDSIDYWRRLVENTGADVKVVEDEKVLKGHAHFAYRKASPTDEEEIEGKQREDAMADGPIRVIVYHPERPQTVRVETGPEGTSIHLGE